MGTVITAVALTAWFIVSAVGQLTVPRRLLDRLRAWDIFGIVPNYRFFAPRPVQHDYHLLMRTAGSSGEFGPWHQVAGPPDRCWWHIAWNPDRRAFKGLSDVMSVAHRFDVQRPRAVQVSLPYLAILNYVTAVASRDPAAREVQFVLAISHGVLSDESPDVIFKSGRHRLGESR
ncbi:hypothetical protein [Kitasatospora sp. NPDC127116]|uniref:hypothetical protein n=1 Tax=Kitasatospora sp. NPDC127116 TaxID=3345367 RepID=UPI003636DC36